MTSRTTIIIGSIVSGLIIVILAGWWFLVEFPTILRPINADESSLINKAQEANQGFTDVLNQVADSLPTSTPVIIAPTPAPVATSTVTSTQEIIP